MDSLRAKVSRICEALKSASDDGTFETAAAVDHLLDWLIASNAHMDDITQHVLRLGCRVVVASRGTSIHESTDRQHTFEDYDAGWLDEDVALSDSHDAKRKRAGDCNLEQARMVHALLAKKVEQTERRRDQWADALKDHPEWRHTPEMTLEQIIFGRRQQDGPAVA